MMFNQFFPNKPPYVRVVNYEKKKVNSYYEIYESPNDKNSYVLNGKLNNLTSWQPGNRCVINLFKRSNRYLRSWGTCSRLFPFTRTNSNRHRSRKSPLKSLNPRKRKITVTLPIVAHTTNPRWLKLNPRKTRIPMARITAKNSVSSVFASSQAW